MTDYGLPYIADKNLFAAAMQARTLIAEQGELPGAAIAQAALRFKVSEVDVGHYTCIGVAWTMAVRTLRRERRSTQESPPYAVDSRRVVPESTIDFG